MKKNSKQHLNIRTLEAAQLAHVAGGVKAFFGTIAKGIADTIGGNPDDSGGTPGTDAGGVRG